MSKLVTALMCFASTATAHAQNIVDGERKATTCIACHGPKGVSSNPLWPNLAGQKEQYMLKQIRAFQVGERNDPLMAPMAKTLSEKDAQDVAAYFASIKIELQQ